MFQFQKFFIYAAVSGLIMISWTYYAMNFGKKKEDIQDEIAEASWQSGLNQEFINSLVMISMLLFGWVLLPYEIVSQIGDILKGRKED